MKALEEKIVREGTVLPGDILKVGSFFNQQMDVDFLMEMGREISRLFSDAGATKILTVEASGIALAVAAAADMHIPAVFAKKHKTANVSGDVYSTVVHSYTHNKDFNITVPKAYIKENDKILIVDDFLATGYAVDGLLNIIEQAGATAVGAAIGIEKGFQGGSDVLRQKGLRVESLAVIESMKDGKITFRD